jgi:hypothetical protein
VHVAATHQITLTDYLIEYRVRTAREALDFFRKGRVFEMLWGRYTSAIQAGCGTENTAITVHRYSQGIFSQVRRFVVVDVNRNRNFVYAWLDNDRSSNDCKLTRSSAISTYGRQGALKRGCNASEHTIVYLKGTDPVWIPGERERGMTKEPIMIEPTEALETMQPSSRLRCGKIHSIEWNVKVRDIGMVTPRDKAKLLRYYREEQNERFDPNDDLDPSFPYSQTPPPYPQQMYRPMPRSYYPPY